MSHLIALQVEHRRRVVALRVVLFSVSLAVSIELFVLSVGLFSGRGRRLAVLTGMFTFVLSVALRLGGHWIAVVSHVFS